MRNAFAVFPFCGMALLSGCGFGAGFRDGMQDHGAALMADTVADAIDKKLGDNFKELSDSVRTIPTGIPKPEKPEDNTLGYTLGTLAALIVSNVLRGGVRLAKEKGKV